MNNNYWFALGLFGFSAIFSYFNNMLMTKWHYQYINRKYYNWYNLYQVMIIFFAWFFVFRGMFSK
jgi:hypothetical protein